MEYVPQGSLAGKIAGGKFSMKQILELTEQLAEVVGYLHRQGVVHGNLKPSNVLFAADGIPRIADLHLTGGLMLGALQVDGVGSAKLAYLAPELIADRAATPRPNTDVYGLGLILYELLTGQRPFSGGTAEETLNQVCSQMPIPPSRINPAVTGPLQALCLRCLQKNPWRRFSRIYDVARQLRQFQERA
jgi:serine/threonine protein kinase